MIEFGHLLSESPGVRRWVRTIVEDLDRGCSAVVVLPRGVAMSPVWQMTHEQLIDRDCNVADVYLPNLGSEEAAPVALAAHLGVSWSSQELRTAESLAAHRGLPEVILLSGFARLSEAQRSGWMSVVRRWALVSQGVEAKGQRPSALALLLDGMIPIEGLPKPDVWLNVHWWWTVTTALEMRLLCRTGNAGVASDGGDLRALWRENVLPSLVGSDIALAEVVWDRTTEESEEIIACLCRWAQEQGWSVEQLLSLGVDAAVRSASPAAERHRLEPRGEQRRLWVDGLLNWTPEYGAMVSAAALAVLGKTKLIEHRLWRGQVGLLMPLINHIRLRLCERWTEQYGYDWPSRWWLPDSADEEIAVRETPLATGWGHIENLLKGVNEMARERTLLLPLVSHARHVRNRLAHYHPVAYADLEFLWHRADV